MERRRPETQRARRRFQTRLSRLPAQDLVFRDESGGRTDLTRRYGRAPKGERVRAAVPHGHWKALPILGALTIQGVQAAMTVEAATDTDVFSTFVQEVLGPTLRPGQIVVMDNLSAHQPRKIRRLLAAHRCRLRYWPVYSPDWNPMEMAGSRLKTFLRATKARLRPALAQAVGDGLRTITAQEAKGWFRHCGYPL